MTKRDSTSAFILLSYVDFIDLQIVLFYSLEFVTNPTHLSYGPILFKSFSNVHKLFI